MKKFLRKWWWILLLIPVLALGGFVIWAQSAASPMPEALAALESDAQVQVSAGSWLLFTPLGQAPTTGLIFYPGGRVDPRAYAPPARAIAAQGYLVVIVPMPLNLAVLDAAAAAEVIAAYPQIRRWAIGGHSLGGSMAANYARQNPNQVHGLLFWASYPASGDDLSSQALAVASIYATLDGLTTVADIEASRPLLPADTAWTEIQGGNHAQFGWYGPQAGDNPAAISREAQQAQIIAASLALLENLE